MQNILFVALNLVLALLVDATLPSPSQACYNGQATRVTQIALLNGERSPFTLPMENGQTVTLAGDSGGNRGPAISKPLTLRAEPSGDALQLPVSHAQPMDITPMLQVGQENRLVLETFGNDALWVIMQSPCPPIVAKPTVTPQMAEISAQTRVDGPQLDEGQPSNQEPQITATAPSTDVVAQVRIDDPKLDAGIQGLEIRSRMPDAGEKNTETTVASSTRSRAVPVGLFHAEDAGMVVPAPAFGLATAARVAEDRELEGAPGIRQYLIVGLLLMTAVTGLALGLSQLGMAVQRRLHEE